MNSSNRYVAAVLKDGIVSHLPRQLSRILSLFILRNGTTDSIVTGRRRYSADLSQGGLKNLCILFFSGKHDEINKLKYLLLCKATSVTNKKFKAMSVSKETS